MTVMRSTPPFRADHVGSLLRPPQLLAARDDFAAGRIDAAQLKAVEDEAITEAVAMQARGRPAVRHRRRVPPRLLAHGLHLPARRHQQGAGPHGRQVPQRDRQHRVHARGAARGQQDPAGAARSSSRTSATCRSVVTSATPKLTIPSPNMVHYRGGPAMIDQAVYPDMEEFWSDLSAAYAEQVARLAGLGCTYLQLDDTSLAYLNDPAQRAEIAEPGRGRRAHAPALHPPGQRRDRGPARGHGRDHAHVPGQLPVVLGRRGRLRLRGRGPVQRAGGGRVLPGVRRRALGQVRAAPLRPRGQDGRARAW